MSKQKFETVDEAVKHIAELEAAHKEKVKTITEASKDKAKDLEEKIKQMTDNTTTIEKERDGANEELGKALEEIASLSEQLDIRSQSKSGAEVVKIGKKSYTLHGKRFNIPGFGSLSAKELTQNSDALDYLVKVKSGVLVEAKGSK